MTADHIPEKGLKKLFQDVHQYSDILCLILDAQVSAVRAKPYQQQCRVHPSMGCGEEDEAHHVPHFTVVYKKHHFTEEEITDLEII